MRLCDDPDARARLHIQAAANHGRMVMLDAAYDASGLTATFTEQTTSAPESQRILTTMCADTPAASAARRIAYAYHDLIGTVGNPPTVTAGLLAQRIAQIAPIVLPESELGAAPPVRVAAAPTTHARSNCTAHANSPARMHPPRRPRPCCGSTARRPTGSHAPRCGVSKTGMRPTPWSTTPPGRSTTSSWTC